MTEKPERHERSRRELYKLGKGLRDATPRQSLADFEAAPSRDPLAIIETTLGDRLPSLRPLRGQLMSGSAFAFLRGTADVSAFDMAHQRAPGISAQAGGDCHLMNFGAFLSPEGNVLFDVNDFDETLPNVDIVHDLRRLATSIVVAADHMGYPDGDARDFARRAVKCYRKRVFELAVMSPIDAWNVRVPLRDLVGLLRDRVVNDRLSTAIYTGKGPESRIDGLPKIEKTREGWRIVTKPPKLQRLDAMQDDEARLDVPKLFEELIRDGLQEPIATLFRRYTLCDWAFKAVGVGSVGVFCAIGLFMSDDDQPLALQIKEAKPSLTLARAHARSSQPAALAGYMGKGEAFDDALASFAMLYAKQIKADFEVFRRARPKG